MSQCMDALLCAFLLSSMPPPHQAIDNVSVAISQLPWVDRESKLESVTMGSKSSVPTWEMRGWSP